jgi:hypothetical protein
MLISKPQTTARQQQQPPKKGCLYYTAHSTQSLFFPADEHQSDGFHWLHLVCCFVCLFQQLFFYRVFIDDGPLWCHRIIPPAPLDRN